MLSEGTRAPDFALRGLSPHAVSTYRLSREVDRGRAVVVAFYPFDFSPVCTSELCALRDAEWFDFLDDVSVWGISADSVYAHRAFAERYSLELPLLSDSNGAVADEFGVRYDEWEGHAHVPKRAVFVVDSDRTVRYAWSSDEAYVEPDFAPVAAAIRELGHFHDGVDPAVVEAEVEYEPVEDPLPRDDPE